MKIIRPFQTSDVALVSSTVSATDPNASGSYNPATTYAIATVVQVDSPTFTFTASGYLFTAVAHGFGNGTILQTASSGTLPPGLTAATRYYMVQVTADTYKLAMTRNGTPISTTGAGTGTHTATVSTHKLYESVVSSNTGNTPHKSPDHWIEIGQTNRWKCLDTSTASQTFNADSVTYVLQTTGRVDSVYAGNIDATDITITARESGGGAIVYGPVTYNLRKYVATFWDWCFSEIEFRSEFVDIDLPPYADMEVTVTLARTGGTVKVGTLLLGLSKTLGTSLTGMTFSINDYSIKTSDEWGNYTFTERPFSKRGTFQVMVDAAMVDTVGSELAKVRATPVVFVGTETYAQAIIFGKFNSYSIAVVYDSYSMCNLEIEGLT